MRLIGGGSEQLMQKLACACPRLLLSHGCPDDTLPGRKAMRTMWFVSYWIDWRPLVQSAIWSRHPSWNESPSIDRRNAETGEQNVLLRVKGAVITLAVDWWTNTRNRSFCSSGLFSPQLYLCIRKVANVVLIMNGEAYFLRSIEIANNSAEQYFQLLKEDKKLLEENGAMVCAIMGDNAPGVQIAIGRCASGCVYAVFFPQD